MIHHNIHSKFSILIAPNTHWQHWSRVATLSNSVRSQRTRLLLVKISIELFWLHAAHESYSELFRFYSLYAVRSQKYSVKIFTLLRIKIKYLSDLIRNPVPLEPNPTSARFNSSKSPTGNWSLVQRHGPFFGNRTEELQLFSTQYLSVSELDNSSLSLSLSFETYGSDAHVLASPLYLDPLSQKNTNKSVQFPVYISLSPYTLCVPRLSLSLSLSFFLQSRHLSIQPPASNTFPSRESCACVLGFTTYLSTFFLASFVLLTVSAWHFGIAI